MSVSVGVLENQGDYTPTQTDFPNYTHAEFNVDPAYCPLTYTYSYEKLNNGDTAITKTATEREFSFRYDNEIDDGDTETVTVTATSSSLYTTTSTEQASGSWDLTFADPCLDADYVTFSNLSQTSPDDNTYDGDQVWTYSPITISPAWCTPTVECLDVVDSNDASVTDKIACATPDDVTN